MRVQWRLLWLTLCAISVAFAAPAAGVDQLYAALARAQNAAMVGNMPLVHTQLQRAQRTSRGLGGRYAALQGDLQRLNTHRVITTSEVEALIGKLGNQESLSSKKPASALLGLGASTLPVSVWQVPLSVVLALLAGAATYLFGRAFARGKHWRGLWLGLIIGLLPTMLDGLLALLGALGALTGWGPLRSLLALLSWQSSWGWLPRGLCWLVGLGLWLYNLRYIALQFGVVGRSKKSVTLTEIKSSTMWELD